MRMIYEYEDGREAAFDIHTSWVTPDNFPGYVEQEVQFRFDNGVWNGHSRKRGVECTIEGKTPLERKITINNHYNGTFLEPWGERSPAGLRRGRSSNGSPAKSAYVEYGGDKSKRGERLAGDAGPRVQRPDRRPPDGRRGPGPRRRSSRNRPKGHARLCRAGQRG